MGIMDTAATEFEIVPAEEMPQRHAGTPPSALSLALEKGETVFVPGWNSVAPSRFRAKASYLRLRGFRVAQRQGERNGIKGLYLRAEKRTNGSEP